ncbi:MAG TPA: zf-HC2 domain-containing protein [Bryobacteraceae bacterium]|nr:zf-HC2 domain-containing protein [Bryobacteraceae bacterium]
MQSAAAPDHPFVEVLELYATNDMGPRRKKKVAQHLEQCAECRTQLAQIRDLRRRLRDLLRSALVAR